MEVCMFENEFEAIENDGIVPVVALEKNEDAVPLAKALLQANIFHMEITFRNPRDFKGTAGAIRAVKNECPEMIVGAGTVLTKELAILAIDAGAKFIVAPGTNDAVIDYCIEKKIAVLPGVSTPTEITKLYEKGLRVLKLFPAEVLGGTKFLKAVASPLPEMKFIPSGGVSKENADSYLQTKNVLALSGSWMVSKELLAKKAWTEIELLSREAKKIALGFQFGHVGINYKANDDFLADIKLLEVFGFKGVENPASWFCGKEFEIMNHANFGTHGHIAILTYSVPRALSYLTQFGFEPDMTTAKWAGEKKELIFVYLNKEIGGFAFHLKKR